MTTLRSTLALVLCLASNFTLAHAQSASAVPHAAMPQTSPQLDATFTAWDTDHNGALSLEEFRAGAAGMRMSMVDRRLHAQFASVDADKSGGIDATEYGNLVLIRHAGASAPPLSAFDRNHDQRLNFAEYTDLVRRLAPAPVRGAKPATVPPPAQK